MVQIRAFVQADRADVLELASRLTVGRREWRDPVGWLAAVQGWVSESVDAADLDGHAVFVAELDRRTAGFVTLGTRAHFSGQLDAYVGELAVADWAERRGVGRALLTAAEAWAVEHGYARITLETGATNTGARAFYAAAGFEDEDVRMTKLLEPQGPGEPTTGPG